MGYMPRYYLDGSMKLPTDKQHDMLADVVKVLNQMGIRKTTARILMGTTYQTLQDPHPDVDGNIYFDYSIFERRVREAACYNCQSGNLTVPSHGANEFGLAMNMIWFLCEKYSQSPVYLMEDRKENIPVRVTGYIEALKTILGSASELRWRDDYTSLMFLLRHHNIKDSFDNIYTYSNYGYGGLDVCQFLVGTIFCKTLAEIKTEAVKLENQKSAIVVNKVFLNCHSEMLKHFNTAPDKADRDIEFLLRSDYESRAKLSVTESFGLKYCAVISLEYPPALLIYAYSYAVNQEFESLWLKLAPDVYTDWNSDWNSKRKSSEPCTIPLYQLIMRENEDEFLEIKAPDSGIILSDGMRDNLSSWSAEYQKALQDYHFDPSATKESMEKKLALLLDLLYGCWQTRYVSDSFVQDFLSHYDDVHYQVAILYLLDKVSAERIYYPEMDMVAACKFLACTHNKEEGIVVTALISVMTNHEWRRKLFSF